MPDDDAAAEQAKQLVDGHDVELWQPARKIAVFPAKPTVRSECIFFLVLRHTDGVRCPPG
jgi:hypothetical protein